MRALGVPWIRIKLDMCRIVAYIGEEIRLEDLVLNFPHNLMVQSYAPTELLSGSVNLDGFGCGWYNKKVESDPAQYATLLPLWADNQFPTIAKAVTSSVIISSVRNATPPLPNELSAVQPYASGKYMFTHNGFIKVYEKFRRKMENDLPEEQFNRMQNRTDSAIIFSVFMWKLSEVQGSGSPIREALVKTLDWLKDYSSDADFTSNLNIGISDGENLTFIRHEIKGECNSLYYNRSHKKFPNGVFIASEALDDDAGWNAVPENNMIEIDLGGEPILSDLN